MEVEKTGYVMHYTVEDEKENIYDVSHYYNENINLDSWDIFTNDFFSEIKDEELRREIIDAILKSDEK